MTGQIIRTTTTASGTGLSDEVQISAGFTLVGFDFPEVASTTFTLLHSSVTGGTFKTLKDPLGIYGTAGSAITFTIGSTSLGIFSMPPSLSALLYNYIKIQLSSSEAAGISLIFKSLA